MAFDFGKKKVRDPLPDIQVMMLGARRVGKTSLLASIIKEFEQVTRDTNLVLTKVGGTQAIDEAMSAMKGYFAGSHFPNEVFTEMDTRQTQGFDQFDLKLGIAAKKTVKPRLIRFVDCSGEWISTYVNEADVAEKVEMSSIIVVAIDSILLMEEDGRYNKQNCVDYVTNFIKANMVPDELANDHKMVLFVPLKCEKYYHQSVERVSDPYFGKRLVELNRRVKEAYSDLLGFLTKPNNKPFFTVAILPVLTLGGIEFDEFTVDDVPEIKTDQINYRYCTPSCFGNPERPKPCLAPLYCAQPLLYSLLFEQEKINHDYYKKNFNSKNRKLWHAALREWFANKQNVSTDADYIKELEKLKHLLLRGGDIDGFEIIQDPIGL